jgi:hypothetical protein
MSRVDHCTNMYWDHQHAVGMPLLAMGICEYGIDVIM